MASHDYANQTSPIRSVEPIKETPLTRLARAVERLRKADAHMGSMCNKLVGDQHTMEAKTDRPERGDGFLDSIEDLADSVSDLSDNIAEYAARIERRI